MHRPCRLRAAKAPRASRLRAARVPTASDGLVYGGWRGEPRSTFLLWLKEGIGMIQTDCRRTYPQGRSDPTVSRSFSLILSIGLSCACLAPALAQPVETTASCIDLGDAEFCHGLRHESTRTTEIPRGWFQLGPTTVTVAFEFEGHRSCAANGETHTASFSMSLGGPNDEFISDYPDLWAAVRPSPARLDRLTISSHASMIVRRTTENWASDQVLSEVLSLDGMSVTKGRYIINGYVPVERSMEACRKYFEVD